MLRGHVVDKFHFTCKDGKVGAFDAEVGRQVLADLLDMGEGAKHLGEAALVPANSPISNTGILFKNTLFDENASCHFALGAAYSENMKGSTERSEEENRKLGMNDSLIHVDFMVGGRDVTVTGVKADGTRIVLLKDCLLYTSDAADELLCVDLGGRRIIKKKKHITNSTKREL